MPARVELKIDVEAHTVKEAGNLPEFGAYSLITVAQDPVFRSCRTFKNCVLLTNEKAGKTASKGRRKIR